MSVREKSCRFVIVSDSGEFVHSSYHTRMRYILIAALLLGLMTTRLVAAGFDDFYKLGPDSMVQDGVPQGKIVGPTTLPSQVFPGTQHTYWVYVPAQYDLNVPASLMIFNDGQAFLAADGVLVR